MSGRDGCGEAGDECGRPAETQGHRTGLALGAGVHKVHARCARLLARVPFGARVLHDACMESMDHVVIAVSGLEEARACFRDAGFTVTTGGRHDELPTENALVAFADGSYLELLATRERRVREEWRGLASSPAWERHLRGVSAVARRFLPSLAGRDGVVDVCLRGTTLRSRAADLRRAALAMGDLFGAVPAARPDGSAWIAASAFGIEVAEGAPDGVCAAMLTGCGELPGRLRSLGLRSA